MIWGKIGAVHKRYKILHQSLGRGVGGGGCPKMYVQLQFPGPKNQILVSEFVMKFEQKIFFFYFYEKEE